MCMCCCSVVPRIAFYLADLNHCERLESYGSLQLCRRRRMQARPQSVEWEQFVPLVLAVAERAKHAGRDGPKFNRRLRHSNSPQASASSKTFALNDTFGSQRLVRYNPFGVGRPTVAVCYLVRSSRSYHVSSAGPRQWVIKENDNHR